MKLYLDTEFNSYRGRLISLALVSEEGDEFYEVLPLPLSVHPWVFENVLPVLNKEPIGVLKIQMKLEQFLAKFDEIELIADWPADLEHFCWLLCSGPGERINTPPMIMTIRRDLNSKKSATPHNALADAHAIRNSDRDPA